MSKDNEQKEIFGMPELKAREVLNLPEKQKEVTEFTELKEILNYLKKSKEKNDNHNFIIGICLLGSGVIQFFMYRLSIWFMLIGVLLIIAGAISMHK